MKILRIIPESVEPILLNIVVLLSDGQYREILQHRINTHTDSSKGIMTEDELRYFMPRKQISIADMYFCLMTHGWLVNTSEDQTITYEALVILFNELQAYRAAKNDKPEGRTPFLKGFGPVSLPNTSEAEIDAELGPEVAKLEERLKAMGLDQYGILLDRIERLEALVKEHRADHLALHDIIHVEVEKRLARLDKLVEQCLGNDEVVKVTSQKYSASEWADWEIVPSNDVPIGKVAVVDKGGKVAAVELTDTLPVEGQNAPIKNYPGYTKEQIEAAQKRDKSREVHEAQLKAHLENKHGV